MGVINVNEVGSKAAAKMVVNSILASVTPHPWPNNNDITHQGNWPTDAVMGVQFQIIYHDKVVQVEDPEESNEQAFYRLYDEEAAKRKSCEYFKSHDEYKDWFKKKAEQLCEHDFVYKVVIELYNWDLGPNYCGTQTLG